MSIIAAIPFTQAQKACLEEVAGEQILFLNGSEVTPAQMKEAQVYLGNPSEKLLKDASSLRWLQLQSAGADAYCKHGLLRPDVRLTNAAGAYNRSVAEQMMAFTFAMIRKLPLYYQNQQNCIWKDEGPVLSPEGATVVILGLGQIAMTYARWMKTMGSYIIGIKRHPDPVPDGIDECVSPNRLLECLSRADIVAAVLPGTDETWHLMGDAQFAAMKDTAYFLNAGRGTTVDEAALVRALQSGRLAGAMLDVTEIEPLPENSPLWTTKNLYLTPHVAGGFHIPQTQTFIYEICLENLRAWREGCPLRNVVDRKAGY